MKANDYLNFKNLLCFMQIKRKRTVVCVCLLTAICIAVSVKFHYILNINTKGIFTYHVHQIHAKLLGEDGVAVRNSTNVTIAILNCTVHNLVGRLDINLTIAPTLLNSSQNGDIEPGGIWRPRDCIATDHVAIIIPYRQRKEHLNVLLYYLLPILQRQKLDFRIFVVEQAGTNTFNKGRIMNAGFKEASKMSDFQCFIFHDVDMIPEDDRNMYSCPSQPRHLSPAVDKFGYRIPYTYLVGGVLNLRREHFIKTNGFSNLYWGWGGEDDDMFQRIRKMKLNVSHSYQFGRYKMIKHEGRERSPLRMVLQKTANYRLLHDGLTNLTYQRKFIHNTKLFTHLMVDVGAPPIKQTKGIMKNVQRKNIKKNVQRKNIKKNVQWKKINKNVQLKKIKVTKKPGN